MRAASASTLRPRYDRTHLALSVVVLALSLCRSQGSTSISLPLGPVRRLVYAGRSPDPASCDPECRHRCLFGGVQCHAECGCGPAFHRVFAFTAASDSGGLKTAREDADRNYSAAINGGDLARRAGDLGHPLYFSADGGQNWEVVDAAFFSRRGASSGTEDPPLSFTQTGDDGAGNLLGAAGEMVISDPLFTLNYGRVPGRASFAADRHSSGSPSSSAKRGRDSSWPSTSRSSAPFRNYGATADPGTTADPFSSATGPRTGESGGATGAGAQGSPPQGGQERSRVARSNYSSASKAVFVSEYDADVVAAVLGGTVYVSRDGALSWTTVMLPNEDGRDHVVRLDWHPRKPDTALAVTSGGRLLLLSSAAQVDQELREIGFGIENFAWGVRVEQYAENPTAAQLNRIYVVKPHGAKGSHYAAAEERKRRREGWYRGMGGSSDAGLGKIFGVRVSPARLFSFWPFSSVAGMLGQGSSASSGSEAAGGGKMLEERAGAADFSSSNMAASWTEDTTARSSASRFFFGRGHDLLRSDDFMDEDVHVLVGEDVRAGPRVAAKILFESALILVVGLEQEAVLTGGRSATSPTDGLGAGDLKMWSFDGAKHARHEQSFNGAFAALVAAFSSVSGSDTAPETQWTSAAPGLHSASDEHERTASDDSDAKGGPKRSASQTSLVAEERDRGAAKAKPKAKDFSAYWQKVQLSITTEAQPPTAMQWCNLRVLAVHPQYVHVIIPIQSDDAAQEEEEAATPSSAMNLLGDVYEILDGRRLRRVFTQLPLFSLGGNRGGFGRTGATRLEDASWVDTGLGGVFVATRMVDSPTSPSTASDRDLESFITFDNGQVWEALKVCGDCDEPLRLESVTASRNAPGLLLGTSASRPAAGTRDRGGGAAGLYVSRDGGRTWDLSLRGRYSAQILAAGDLLVAVRRSGAAEIAEAEDEEESFSGSASSSSASSSGGGASSAASSGLVTSGSFFRDNRSRALLVSTDQGGTWAAIGGMGVPVIRGAADTYSNPVGEAGSGGLSQGVMLSTLGRGEKIPVSLDGVRTDELFKAAAGASTAQVATSSTRVSDTTTASDEDSSGTAPLPDPFSPTHAATELYTHPSHLATVLFLQSWDFGRRQWQLFSVDVADAQYRELPVCGGAVSAGAESRASELEPFSVRDESDCHLGERLTFYRRAPEAGCRSRHAAPFDAARSAELASGAVPGGESGMAGGIGGAVVGAASRVNRIQPQPATGGVLGAARADPPAASLSEHYARGNSAVSSSSGQAVDRSFCTCVSADYVCAEGFQRSLDSRICERVDVTKQPDVLAMCANLHWWETEVEITRGYEKMPGNKCVEASGAVPGGGARGGEGAAAGSRSRTSRFSPMRETCVVSSYFADVGDDSFNARLFYPLQILYQLYAFHRCVLFLMVLAFAVIGFVLFVLFPQILYSMAVSTRAGVCSSAGAVWGGLEQVGGTLGVKTLSRDLGNGKSCHDHLFGAGAATVGGGSASWVGVNFPDWDLERRLAGQRSFCGWFGGGCRRKAKHDADGLEDLDRASSGDLEDGQRDGEVSGLLSRRGTVSAGSSFILEDPDI